MIYEVNLILFSPTQCPDYKQLFIVTYSNKRVMGPHLSMSLYSFRSDKDVASGITGGIGGQGVQAWVSRMVNANVFASLI